MNFRLFISVLSLLFVFRAQAQVNFGFETGDFTGWTGIIGDNTICDTCAWSSVSSGIFNGALNPAYNDHTARQSIMDTSAGNDHFGNFPIVAAGLGNYVARLGNNSANYQAQEILQTWVVAANTKLLFSYAVVMSNGGHVWLDANYFEYEITDNAGNTIAQHHDIGTAPLPAYQYDSTQIVFYLPWTTDTIDLTSHAGDSLTIRIAAVGCLYAGDYTIAYVNIDPYNPASVVEQAAENSFSIFPNPGKDVFEISGNNFVMKTMPVVCDLHGRQIDCRVIPAASGWKIDLSGHAPGVYFVSVLTDAGFVCRKMILLEN